VPLDDSQRHRLAQALSGIYGKSVQVNVVLDPEVVGGIRVQVGDEVVDGTILPRLEEARRLLAG
jgi:F-type H+-transporting ATPase subunit delta